MIELAHFCGRAYLAGAYRGYRTNAVTKISWSERSL